MTASRRASTSSQNLDRRTVEGFGQEWSHFDQSGLSAEEAAVHFGRYFSLVPWDDLPADSLAIDVGCGSGRWAALAAERVGHLLCLDASADALAVARRTVGTRDDVSFVRAEVGGLPVADGVADLVYSLGVLHHVPDTARAIATCARAVRPGGLLLLYLYYRFDDRPWWFRAIWRASDLVRRLVSRAPFAVRRRITDLVALLVYLPAARAARFAERRGRDVSGAPLAFYRDASWYTMRTDALDRLGTRLEQRFTRAEVQSMVEAAGLTDVRFRDGEPYWCVLARRPD